MIETLLIGLDCSTTSVTAVAWNARGKPMASGKAPIQTTSPQPGFAEQDPEEWWRASMKALQECNQACGKYRVAGIGVTFQRETFALLDDDSHVMRPAILWYDSRAVAELNDLRRTLDPESIHRLTGKPLDITFVAPKLLWLAKHEPDILRPTRRLVDVGAFLAMKLVGRAATPVCGIDTSGLVGLDGTWCRAALRMPGIPDLHLPELLPPATVAGNLKARAAAETGLPKGIPVTIAGGDGHCFAHGALASAPGKKPATLTLGTSAVVGVPCSRAHCSQTFRTLLACKPGDYLQESVIQCGADTLNWFDNVFSTAGRPHADWDAACADVPPGSHGLLVLPHWRGSRVPIDDPDARGVVIGWNDQVTEAAFRRAIMEGMAFEFQQLLSRSANAADYTPECIVVGGGGAAADVWCQILASVFNRRVLRPETVELASLGAALCAAEAAGTHRLDMTIRPELNATHFEPTPEHVPLYAERRRIHAHIYSQTRALSGLMARTDIGQGWTSA